MVLEQADLQLVVRRGREVESRRPHEVVAGAKVHRQVTKRILQHEPVDRVAAPVFGVAEHLTVVVVPQIAMFNLIGGLGHPRVAVTGKLGALLVGRAVDIVAREVGGFGDYRRTEQIHSKRQQRRAVGRLLSWIPVGVLARRIDIERSVAETHGKLPLVRVVATDGAVEHPVDALVVVLQRLHVAVELALLLLSGRNIGGQARQHQLRLEAEDRRILGGISSGGAGVVIQYDGILHHLKCLFSGCLDCLSTGLVVKLSGGGQQAVGSLQFKHGILKGRLLDDDVTFMSDLPELPPDLLLLQDGDHLLRMVPAEL